MTTHSINGKIYNFYSMRGTVVGSTKESRTHVYGGGGGGQYGRTYISSYNTIHDTIFVKDASGMQHEIRMQNWDIGTLVGHELLFIWAVQSGNSRGPYLCVKNLSTGMVYTAKNEMKNMSRYSFAFMNLRITLPMTSLFFLFWIFYTFFLSKTNAWWKKDSTEISACCFGVVLLVFVIGLVISSGAQKKQYKSKVYNEINAIIKKMLSDNKEQILNETKGELEVQKENTPKGNDPIEEIERLFQMKEKGIISEEEFKTMKDKLLNRD